MNDKNNKTTDDQEQLLDHLIEYGGKQYIEEEVQKFEDIPELEPSKEFDDKMQAMFKKAYQKEVRKERMQLGKKIAAVFVIVLGIAMVTAMNVKAFREPVLNFIFNRSSNLNDETKVDVKDDSKTKEKFTFGYIPDGYKLEKEQHLHNNTQITYDYKNKNNDYLFIKIQVNQKYSNYLKQSKKDNYEKLNVNKKSYFILKNNKTTLLFYKNYSIFTIISKESQSEIIKIAENIQ